MGEAKGKEDVSFVLQLWLESAGGESSAWRWRVQHVQSGPGALLQERRRCVGLPIMLRRPRSPSRGSSIGLGCRRWTPATETAAGQPPGIFSRATM